jgi:hypothetical protein
VGYEAGAHAFFGMATNSNRYLLTFRSAGHRIGLGPAPDEMRNRLWDLDWFEDPVWRSDRDRRHQPAFHHGFSRRYVKDDTSRAAILDGPDSEIKRRRLAGCSRRAVWWVQSRHG